MLLSKTSCLAVILCLAALATSALSQDDQSKSRSNLLLRRGSGGRPNPLAKSTTTTPQPEYSDDEYVDEDGERPEGDEGEEPAPGRPVVTTTTTTTESPKKIRPTVRPFRSNEDLLTTLKKRRLESKNHKPAPPKEKVYDDEDVPAPAPAKSAKAPAIAVSKGRRFGAARKEAEQSAAPSEQSEETNNGDTGAKSLTSRLGRSRFALKQQ